MSETKWTQEQWDAITEKDRDLLVAAAAGAGKTAVLVERIIKKITDAENPVDIDRLLIVTFTNAAATEMRERISGAIASMLEKSPESTAVQRQLALLGKASITTIHSFCMDVIRNNFQSLDIDPNFRIADDTESMLMKLEAVNELFEEQYEIADNDAFFDLLECYGGNRDDQILMDMVLNLYDFIQSSPWPYAWLDEMTENLNVPNGTDFGSTVWGKVLLTATRLELEGLKDRIERAISLVTTGMGLEKYVPVYKEDLINIEGLLKLASGDYPSWDKLFNTLQSLEFTTLPRAGKDADKELQEKVKGIRDDVKTSIRKLRERIITADSDMLTGDLRTLYPRMKYLSDLVKGMAQKYTEKKKRKSLADFNDLEHLCLELLSKKDENGMLIPSDIARSYRERFAEILVDEYQDSNLVQEIMIKMISGSSVPVFMVGDVKQSIYRFRQARPELFLHKYNTYSANKGGSNRKILLFKNFRSRKTVIDAVNFIFKQVMSVNAGELDYTDEEALNPGAVFEENIPEDMVCGGNVELHLVQTNSQNGDESEEKERESEEAQGDEQEEEEILDKIQCEARIVAGRIRSLLTPEDGKTFSVWDKHKREYRKAEFRDIVILLRTTKNWSEVFVEELALMGIPAFADTGSGFFKTIEVQVVLSLLQIIDNPLQDIPLLSVLRSPIVSFTTDELAQLRLANRKAPLYEALVELAGSGTGSAAQKAKEFLKSLERWRRLSLHYSTDQLLWRLYDETGYYGMVGAMPAGEQRQANLRVLFERARQFEETSYKGLFNFISFIDRLKTGKGDMGSAKTLSENDNVVRIMSIHKSKGLEFPVVFLSGCGKKFNLQDMNKSILLHQDLGFGPDVVDHRLRLSWPSAAKQAIREKIKTETLSEEMRILYVALTRAREKLIITGAVNNMAKSLQKWLAMAGTNEARIPDHEVLKGGNYLDWICPALLRHRDSGVLRDIAPIGTGFEGNIVDDDSRWSIRIWNRSDVTNTVSDQETDDDGFSSWLDSLSTLSPDELKAEIDRRLGWNYKYSGLSEIPAKLTVTELKRRFNHQATEEGASLPDYLPKLAKKPMFMEEKKGLTSAEKGTILHFVMQHLDLEIIKPSAAPEKEVIRQIDLMVEKDLLTRQQAHSVDTGKVCGFFASDLGKRMLASNRVNREVPFYIELSLDELYPDMDKQSGEGEKILLQGVIDCFFEEDDGIVLIDYKTDYVPNGEEGKILERYRTQIGYYARALEKLTGKAVKGRYIYLFWSGKEAEL